MWRSLASKELKFVVRKEDKIKKKRAKLLSVECFFFLSLQTVKNCATDKFIFTQTELIKIKIMDVFGGEHLFFYTQSDTSDPMSAAGRAISLH